MHVTLATRIQLGAIPTECYIPGDGSRAQDRPAGAAKRRRVRKITNYHLGGYGVYLKYALHTADPTWHDQHQDPFGRLGASMRRIMDLSTEFSRCELKTPIAVCWSSWEVGEQI